jgi:heptosyltransferase-2
VAAVLIVAPNWLGDAMMALPAIRDVRRHFSDRPLMIGARASIASVFRAVPGIDRIIVLDRSKAPANIPADIGLLLPNSFRSAWDLKRSGVQERWGYRSDFRGLLLTRAVRRPRTKVPFPEYYAHLVRQLGIETGPLTAELKLPESMIVAGAALLEQQGWRGTRPLVGLAPGAAFGHAKRWPSRRFRDLSATLARDGGAACVILGRGEDRDAAQGIEGIDLIGRTDLPLLMGVVAHCDVLVANDSGALHLAAALGVPVVGLYGPTDERYSTPLSQVDPAADRVRTLSERVFCRPCFMADCPIDHRCMKRISTERVREAVLKALQEGRG